MRARVVGGRVGILAALTVACHPQPDAKPVAEMTLAPDSKARPIDPEPSVPSDPSARSEIEPTRLVLVTVDGVRWEDALGPEREGEPFETRMPNLDRLVHERGSAVGGAGCEHDVRASGPNFVSLPGYLEMFTGKPSTCTHNGCPPVATDTVLDEAHAADAGEIAVFASWNKYSHAVARDRRAMAISTGARAPALAAAKDDDKLRFLLEVGAANPGYPGWGDYRPDTHTAKIALRYLETVRPRVLVLGLGDADEQAHRGDFAGYRRAVARADDILGELEQTLGRMGDEGRRTAVLVTTDHGRGRGPGLRSHGAGFPESQRVFVAAFGDRIAHRGIACPAEPLRLAHLAGTVRALLDIGKETSRGPLAAELLSAGR